MTTRSGGLYERQEQTEVAGRGEMGDSGRREATRHAGERGVPTPSPRTRPVLSVGAASEGGRVASVASGTPRSQAAEPGRPAARGTGPGAGGAGRVGAGEPAAQKGAL